jgi:AraC-like DNA-binding protein
MARVRKECCRQGLPVLQNEHLATLARRSGYRVKGMACQLRCSCRWLELLCHKQFALTPHAWLIRLRAAEIKEQAHRGVPAKVLCQLVGFADTASFCHSLKRSTGCTLRELRELGCNACSQKDNKAGSLPISGTRESILVSCSGLQKGADTLPGAACAVRHLDQVRQQKNLKRKGKCYGQ